MSNNLKMIIAVVLGLAILTVVIIKLSGSDSTSNATNDSSQQNNEYSSSVDSPLSNPVPEYISSNFRGNLDNNNIDWSEVGSGGVPKDGIPSIDNPKFESILETDIPADTEGLLLEIDSEAKFYSYNILVRHEITNDELAGIPVAVTFCPLCGSGIAFDRRVGDQTLEFGVSGFLRESNMIMYDRQTESLWQQSLGKSFAGDLNETQLTFLPIQLLTIAEAQNTHPNAKILTTDTGIYSSSAYTDTPYGDYDTNNDSFIFRPSNLDESFPSKEVFQIVLVDDYSIAIRRENLPTSQKIAYPFGDLDGPAIDLLISIGPDGRIEAIDQKGNKYPAYFEMWFSWAVQHEDDPKALVWEPVLK